MQDPTTRAVFVDPTGRRSRIVARACWLLGTFGVAYVALVVVSLLLPPGAARLSVPGLGPVLPGPAAAPLGRAEGQTAAPDVLLTSPQPSPARAASPSPGAVRPSPVRASPVVVTPSPRPAASAAPPARPSAGASPRPSRTAAAPERSAGQPSTAPSRRASAAPATPPGQTPSRSPRPRPSASRGPR